jgi:hypothetical protein
MPTAAINVRFRWWKTGKQLFWLSIWHFDPKRNRRCLLRIRPRGSGQSRAALDEIADRTRGLQGDTGCTIGKTNSELVGVSRPKGPSDSAGATSAERENASSQQLGLVIHPPGAID